MPAADWALPLRTHFAEPVVDAAFSARTNDFASSHLTLPDAEPRKSHRRHRRKDRCSKKERAAPHAGLATEPNDELEGIWKDLDDLALRTPSIAGPRPQPHRPTSPLLPPHSGTAAAAPPVTVDSLSAVSADRRNRSSSARAPKKKITFDAPESAVGSARGGTALPSALKARPGTGRPRPADSVDTVAGMVGTVCPQRVGVGLGKYLSSYNPFHHTASRVRPALVEPLVDPLTADRTNHKKKFWMKTYMEIYFQQRQGGGGTLMRS
mmetsp:Transcript_11666/g.21089  ORF Transcript_11666/g.21089 Transcript_11666/m.21089 type:complete len:266 (-) Transcript_11666:488-1285(-)